jgi:DNA modification methylase
MMNNENMEEYLNKIILGNNVDSCKKLPDACIDLVVTSPPYDDIRNYDKKLDISEEQKVDNNGYSFPFEPLAKELVRILKPGGVIAWVVGDGTDENSSETGTSFRQALYFKELGLNIHDTMIYEKNGCSFPSTNRYYQVFEYMFILSKGKPKTTTLIKDRKNIWAGVGSWGKKTQRGKNDELIETESHITPEYGARFNIWRYNTGAGFSTKDEEAFEHPAIFPEKLAEDHILSWSLKGDVVLDPFMGSGTTGKMAAIHGRKWIGMDINQKYIDIAEKRIKDYQTNIDELFE